MTLRFIFIGNLQVISFPDVRHSNRKSLVNAGFSSNNHLIGDFPSDYQRETLIFSFGAKTSYILSLCYNYIVVHFSKESGLFGQKWVISSGLPIVHHTSVFLLFLSDLKKKEKVQLLSYGEYRAAHFDSLEPWLGMGHPPKWLVVSPSI